MSTDRTIPVLNSLIDINNERIQGYEIASKETHELDLIELFSSLSVTSEKCKDELEIEVLRMGGRTNEGTLSSGKIFRVWTDFKASVKGYDRKAILDSCDQGENCAVALYERILQDQPSENLSSEQTRMVFGQYRSIKSDHDHYETFVICRSMLIKI